MVGERNNLDIYDIEKELGIIFGYDVVEFLLSTARKGNGHDLKEKEWVAFRDPLTIICGSKAFAKELHKAIVPYLKRTKRRIFIYDGKNLIYDGKEFIEEKDINLYALKNKKTINIKTQKEAIRDVRDVNDIIKESIILFANQLLEDVKDLKIPKEKVLGLDILLKINPDEALSYQLMFEKAITKKAKEANKKDKEVKND